MMGTNLLMAKPLRSEGVKDDEERAGPKGITESESEKTIAGPTRIASTDPQQSIDRSAREKAEA